MKKIPDPAGFNHKAHENADHWLADLRDVNLSTAPTDGQALVYDTDTGLWLPSTVGGGAGFSPFSYTPGAYGWLAWTFDPVEMSGGTSIGGSMAGRIHYTGFIAASSGTIDTLVVWLQAADASANTVYLGVYDSSGTKLADTGNVASSLTTGGDDTKDLAVTSFTITAGSQYWVAALTTVADPTEATFGYHAHTPKFTENPLTSQGLNLRTGVSDTATHTSLPSSITPSTNIVYHTSALYLFAALEA